MDRQNQRCRRLTTKCCCLAPGYARPRWVRVKASKGRTSSCRPGQALLLRWVWVVLMVLMGNRGRRQAEVIGPLLSWVTKSPVATGPCLAQLCPVSIALDSKRRPCGGSQPHTAAGISAPLFSLSLFLGASKPRETDPRMRQLVQELELELEPWSWQSSKGQGHLGARPRQTSQRAC